MNMNRMMNMVVQIVMRRGVSGAIDLMARRGKSTGDMTASERENARTARQTGQKAQRGFRLLRRFLR